MNKREFFAWILIILGVIGVAYEDISNTASVITFGIGVYLFVNSQK